MSAPFFPKVTLQGFHQSLIDTNVPENKIKEMAFAALSKFSEEQLTKDLSNEWKGKIKKWVEERKSTVLSFVRDLNQLGDLKDILRANAIFQEYKRAITRVVEIYKEMRANTNPAKFGSMAAELKEKFPTSEKLFQKAHAKSYYPLCYQTSKCLLAIATGYAFYSATDLTKETHLKISRQEFFGLVKDSLVEDMIDESEDECESLKSRVLAGIKLEELKTIVEEQWPLAIQEVAHVKIEKEKKWLAMKQELVTRISYVNDFFSSSLFLAPDYQAHTLHKRNIAHSLDQVSAFCGYEELDKHPKLSNESQTKLRKYFLEIVNHGLK